MTDLIVPNHIGYIVDGNRRWARKHGLPNYEGHLAGYSAVNEVVTATFESGVKYISAYIFSTENWKRSQEEVNKLMGLMLKLLTSDLPIFVKNNIRLVILGSRENVDQRIIKAIDNAESVTAKNTAGTLAICFNYGGQYEIVEAVRKIVKSGVKAKDVDLELISKNLYGGTDIPPVDIVVRTSGEQRLSNFMLWRVAYSEMLFLEKMWPDMRKEDVDDIIKEYSKRSRRFGG
ncbi:MAG: polyprenyl diphosphate synthase [Candidatus Saccharimonadales bacterium]